MRNVTHLLVVAGLASGLAAGAAGGDPRHEIARARATDDWVTVEPDEFPGAINNPLKGFRGYHSDGYGLLHRQYVPWNAIETHAGDTVARVIAHTNSITQHHGRSFADLNVKLIPRVYLDWNGMLGTPERPRQHWPADMAEFDYDSPAFQERLTGLIAKLGEAWDNDPRVFAIQMGLIGYWGEHHHPAPTAAQRRLLVDAFKAAFRHKPILVRHTDPEFMEAGFGIYYDTFANVSREPHMAAARPYIKGQFPWQATHVYPEIWKRAPIEGEVEYNWQRDRDDADPEGTFGRTPDETMTVAAYRRYMIDKIRRYHATCLGWISGYTSADPGVLKGAAELQRAFGYRFVIDSLRYPAVVQPGGRLTVEFKVRNTGSAPFYLDWPVAAVLLDARTRQPVWSAPLEGIDLRRWLPGADWDSDAFAYRTPAETHRAAGRATLPATLPRGEYILALAILDRQGGMVPSARFAVTNYVTGGWHPFGIIGVGTRPQTTVLTNVEFDSPAFDRTLSYHVPEELLAVEAPPVPEVAPVPRWHPDPKTELINPWRYWELVRRSETVAKRIGADGPVQGAAGRRVIRVVGDYGRGTNLSYAFFDNGKIDPGRYRFSCRVRGSPEQTVQFDVADGWRRVTEATSIPLTRDWQEHTVEFEITSPFRNVTRLRFNLPDDASGEFQLTDTRLRKVE